jgi:DNA-binding PadR family transcriptional regulator
MRYGSWFNSIRTIMNRKNEAILDKKNLPKPEDDKAVNGFEEWILSALSGKELYGLQIIQAIEESTEGKVKPSVGNLYPTLQRLERKGYVSTRMESSISDDRDRGGARRKYFRITQTGVRKLAQAAKIRDQLFDWNPSRVLTT